MSWHAALDPKDRDQFVMLLAAARDTAHMFLRAVDISRKPGIRSLRTTVLYSATKRWVGILEKHLDIKEPPPP